MKTKRTALRVLSIFVLFIISSVGCDIFPKAVPDTPTPSPSASPTITLPPTLAPSPTFTDTPIPPTDIPPTETVTPLPVVVDTPTKAYTTSRCYGLHGKLEVRASVSEAAHAGLEPFTIGEIPFSVTTEYAPYRIQGRSKIVYKGKTEEDWGSYKADINLMGSISGQCLTGENDGELRLTVMMSGYQNVQVKSKGYNKTIPWTGGVNMTLNFGHSNGYSIPAEEWIFVLYMGTTED